MAMSAVNLLRRRWWLAWFVALIGVIRVVRAGSAEQVDFNRDVRPILADRCFRCHGPDAGSRKRGLRLDTQDGSRAMLKGGIHAIVPGAANASEAVRRIESEDPDEVMPPPSLNRPLSPEQKATLRRWITEGAVFSPHWSLLQPVVAPLPPVVESSWVCDPIDRWVLVSVEAANLRHAPEASRATILRRVSLVLTGIGTTPEETERFESDPSPRAYEHEVDRLLASPRFGERMAADWLDVARFADTFGYQFDAECRTWPWRDWVLDAMNANMPYDRFIREQLAGDLLPAATEAQRLATAFNRLHRQTNEGGSIDEEFRQEYISDRVHTFGTAFLGLTVECARCHDHKYDPISQREYYSVAAFFGSIDESGTYPYTTGAVPSPTMRLPTIEQREVLRKKADAVRDAEAWAQSARSAAFERARDHFARASQLPAMPPPAHRFPLAGGVESPVGKGTRFDGDTGPVFGDARAFRRCDPYSLVFWMRCPDVKARATVIHTSQFTIESDQQGYQIMLKDGHLCWEVIHVWPGSAAAIRSKDTFPLARWVQVGVTYDGSSQAEGMHMYLDGLSVASEVVRDHLDGPATARQLQVGARDRDLGFKDGELADLQVFDRELTPIEALECRSPGSIAAAEERSQAGSVEKDLSFYYASVIDAAAVAATKDLCGVRSAEQQILETIPEAMVMEESRFPRPAFVLSRGRYDQPLLPEPVYRDRVIDAILPYAPEFPKNRLGLAQWATDPRNPLVARVAVNRLWAICFGRGIVSTLENFGQQGDPPTHPQLLDMLACDLVASGWDVKAMLKRMVLSATFRQSSDLTPETLGGDAQNRFLARGPSHRLSAEMLRDNALSASGLLAEQVGGPSVKPWQPPGLWEDAGASVQVSYVPDSGVSAHRRSLYTYRKRTAPPPNMSVFDSGSREQCLARRQPTDTPLQPLVLLNDPVFVECARSLAKRCASEAADRPDACVARVFVLLTGRPPRQPELDALYALYESQLGDYRVDTKSAEALMGTSPADPALAALTVVSSTVMASDAGVSSR